MCRGREEGWQRIDECNLTLLYNNSSIIMCNTLLGNIKGGNFSPRPPPANDMTSPPPPKLKF